MTWRLGGPDITGLQMEHITRCCNKNILFILLFIILYSIVVGKSKKEKRTTPKSHLTKPKMQIFREVQMRYSGHETLIRAKNFHFNIPYKIAFVLEKIILSQ